MSRMYYFRRIRKKKEKECDWLNHPQRFYPTNTSFTAETNVITYSW